MWSKWLFVWLFRPFHRWSWFWNLLIFALQQNVNSFCQRKQLVFSSLKKRKKGLFFGNHNCTSELKSSLYARWKFQEQNRIWINLNHHIYMPFVHYASLTIQFINCYFLDNYKNEYWRNCSTWRMWVLCCLMLHITISNVLWVWG